MRTNIRRNLPASRRSARETEVTRAQGAATQCYVATSPQLAKVSGEYFQDCNPAPQSAYQQDAAMAAKAVGCLQRS